MTKIGFLEEVLADSLSNLLLDPFLCFRSHPETGGISPITQAGLIPSREDMEDLYEWLQVFYDGFGDDQVDAHNEQRSKELNITFKSSPSRTAPKAPPRAAAKPGYVYMLHAPSQNCYKLGRTHNIKQRMSNILLPFPIELVHSISVPDMIWAERHLHALFADKRLDGEWFTLSDDDVRWICSLTQLEEGGQQ